MKRSNRMLHIIYIFTLGIVLLCIINVLLVSLFTYHLRSGSDFSYYVDNVSVISENLYAKRGNIYDTNGEIVATDEQTYNIICYLDSNRKTGDTIQYVDDPQYTADVLANVLGGDREDIYYYLTYNPDLYQTEIGLIGRNISEEQKDKILSYSNIHGVEFKESFKRIYNQGSDFSPYLIGFAQSDDSGKLVGKMGLELYLDEELSGVDGKHTYQQDRNGYVLNGMYEEIVASQNGYDVYTTLDSSIEQALTTAFEEVSEQNNATKAWGSVVEINTGKILAYGQSPTFDPNVLDIEDYNSLTANIAYEPGSVMKSFIYAAAMDMGVYGGEATFDSSDYCYYSSGNTPYRTYGSKNYGCISNAAGHSWGTIGLDYGLIYSSNVATATLLTDYVGEDKYEEYLDAFGFFKKVDTDGISESIGVKNYTYPSEKLSLTYGQGSSVTMLQLIQAYTAIFGNGEMLKPYYIDKIVDTDNDTVVYQGQRTVVSQPIKETTAKQMQALLERVVTDPKGTAQYYAVDEVDIIAKTGTSEIVEGSGYNSDDSITSVMLAFPADNPKYMIYFAYVSPYDYYNHTFSSPIKNLIKKVAILTGVGYKQDSQIISQKIDSYTMPNLLNKNFKEVSEELSNQGLEVIKIGNGDKVYDQYPKASETVYTGEKVFLLTDNENIILPDFKDWTRKEIIAYWNLSGLSFKLNGYGIVKDQSIAEGSIVSDNQQIIINFEDIESEIVSEEQGNTNEE